MAVTLGTLRTRSPTLDWDFEKWREIPSQAFVKCPKIILLPHHEIVFDIQKTTENLRVDINRLNNTFPLSFHYKVCLIDRNGKERLMNCSRASFAHDSTYITLADWDIKELNNFIGIEDKLILRCTMSIQGESGNQDATSQTDSLPYTEASPSKSLSTLSSDFERLYTSKTDTDFVLKVGDIKFPVHRNIVSARSPVFAAMFRHDTLERSSNETAIQDIEPETLDDVLHYIYSGITRLRTDTVISVFTTADRYELLELKVVCLQFLLQNLTLENVCEAAQLAHTYDEKDLENEVVSFINANIAEVLDNDEWIKFSTHNPLHANKILSAAFRKRI